MHRYFRRGTALLCALLLMLMPLQTTHALPSGDVDGNGTRSTADVRLILQHAVGAAELTDEQRQLADFNVDGTIDTVDVRALLLVVLQGDPLSANAYNGEPYIILNENVPRFSEDEKQSLDAFETYAPLDNLGRCGVAYANLCTELMPTDDRESISSVTPTGWHNQQYDFVSGGWLYNRSHLIGFQLAGENANEQNLITGTRYMNTDGMLPFENMVADYIKETDNHVLYRVTPIFKGDNLLCEGVTIEAWSVEDDGEGICFYVFCFNVQSGVVIDYATGENHADGDTPPVDDEVIVVTFILNTNSKKFHLLTCRYANGISDEHRAESGATREELIESGYSPCGTCKP